ncbi:hypothetical protein [Spirosoma agri]|uniref:Uncharacterized protein n=1 Tax=Spirosoma agri TaxID=1987381 RepID=A0A6M0ILI9_9BACT|nr:hypothetical protein [Spirosoma agri]NEU68757.1 hypothetical protein [Spirosoma agri]
MVTTDVQERIIDVFSRATKSLSKEFQEINIAGNFQERHSLYKAIETDFKDYLLLGRELVVEVKSNILSKLRPLELTRYSTNLNSFLSQVRDGYDYLESDEWIDRIFLDFKTFEVFGSHKNRVQLTEEDKKCIYSIVEEVRVCCYEYVKAADELTAESRDPLPGLAQNFGYVEMSRKIVTPQQSVNPKSPVTEDHPKITNAKLVWRDNRGDKTDFAELVWALAKSHRIIDNKTGKPVTIDVLANQLGALLGISISNPMQLMQGRKESYKATEDGITFIASLSELVEKYIANK